MSRKPGKLLRNISSAAAQIVVQTAALFFLYRFLIDQIGIERLGVWSIILAGASAARVSELGMGGSVTKFVASYRAQGDWKAVGEALQTAAISVAAFLALILLLAYPMLVWLLPEMLPASALTEAYSILPYALVSLWLTSVSSIWLSGMDGCLRSDLRAGLSIFATAIFLVIAWAAVSRYGLLGLAIAQVTQGIILAVLGWIAIRYLVNPLPWIPAQWSYQRFRIMLGYGVSFQVNTFVMLLFEPTTKILLGRYGELSAAGYFELAQRLVMKVRAFIVESNRVIVPVFAGSADVAESMRQLYARNVQFLFLTVTPLFACLIALTPAISELWIGAYQAQFVLIAIVLSAAWYVNSMSAPAYFAFLGRGTLRWITISHLTMGGINLILGIALGLFFGWMGVITAFVVSLLMGSVITIRAYHSVCGLAIRNVLSIQDLGLALACLVAASTLLTVYLAVLGEDVNIWIRISTVVAGMGVATLIAIHRHPVWHQMLSAAKTRLRGSLTSR